MFVSWQIRTWPESSDRCILNTNLKSAPVGNIQSVPRNVTVARRLKCHLWSFKYFVVLILNISDNIDNTKNTGHSLEMLELEEFCDYCFKIGRWNLGWRINAANYFEEQRQPSVVFLSFVMVRGTPCIWRFLKYF